MHNVPESRPRGPRLYHKKSRTGCLRCKQRRVKCDEGRPTCGGCSRHVVECLYPAQAVLASQLDNLVDRTEVEPRKRSLAVSSNGLSVTTGRLQPIQSSSNLLSPHSSETVATLSPHRSTFCPSSSSSHLSPPDDGADTDIDFPEGARRRLWELRLLHSQQNSLVQPFSSPQSEELMNMCREKLPIMALRMAEKGRCSLLYIIFAQSALNLWTRSTDQQERDELIKLQQIYQLMCSKAQRRDIEELGQSIATNADYICLSSLKIVAHSLTLVQTLSCEPWEPPLQWLHMGRGAGEVFGMARMMIDPQSNPFIRPLFNSPPSNLKAEVLRDHSPLAWLLDHPAGPDSAEAQNDRELDVEEVRSVYIKALAYTCSVQSAIDDNEPQYSIVRRLGGFPVFVPADFIKFVEERRPRALVVLAYFMALWTHEEECWIIGKAGQCQVRAIHRNVPIDWASKLDGLYSKYNTRRQDQADEGSGRF